MDMSPTGQHRNHETRYTNTISRASETERFLATGLSKIAFTYTGMYLNRGQNDQDRILLPAKRNFIVRSFHRGGENGRPCAFLRERFFQPGVC